MSPVSFEPWSLGALDGLVLRLVRFNGGTGLFRGIVAVGFALCALGRFHLLTLTLRLLSLTLDD
jgi:hypothetical protein